MEVVREDMQAVCMREEDAGGRWEMERVDPLWRPLNGSRRR